MATTKMIRPGEYSVEGAGKGFCYRIVIETNGRGGSTRRWRLIKRPKGSPGEWVLVQGGFKSKFSALEYCLEEIERDDQEYAAKELIHCIDDGIDLNDEGGTD